MSLEFPKEPSSLGQSTTQTPVLPEKKGSIVWDGYESDKESPSEAGAASSSSLEKASMAQLQGSLTKRALEKELEAQEVSSVKKKPSTQQPITLGDLTNAWRKVASKTHASRPVGSIERTGGILKIGGISGPSLVRRASALDLQNIKEYLKGIGFEVNDEFLKLMDRDEETFLRLCSEHGGNLKNWISENYGKDMKLLETGLITEGIEHVCSLLDEKSAGNFREKISSSRLEEKIRVTTLYRNEVYERRNRGGAAVLPGINKKCAQAAYDYISTQGEGIDFYQFSELYEYFKGAAKGKFGVEIDQIIAEAKGKLEAEIVENSPLAAEVEVRNGEIKIEDLKFRSPLSLSSHTMKHLERDIEKKYDDLRENDFKKKARSIKIAHRGATKTEFYTSLARLVISEGNLDKEYPFRDQTGRLQYRYSVETLNRPLQVIFKVEKNNKAYIATFY